MHENVFNQNTNIALPILFHSQWVERSAATRQKGQVFKTMWEGRLKASKGLKADFTPRCTTNSSARANGLPAHSRVPTNVRHPHFITACTAQADYLFFFFIFLPPPSQRALQHITVHNSKQSPLGNVNTLKRKVVVSAPWGRKRVITFAESWIMDWVAVISSMICIECRMKTESEKKRWCWGGGAAGVCWEGRREGAPLFSRS